MNALTTKLKVSDLVSLVGKTIKWDAFTNPINHGYFGKGHDGGICIIRKINDNPESPTLYNSVRPILEVEIIEGADITTAHIDFFKKDVLSFTDNDRHICYEVL